MKRVTLALLLSFAALEALPAPPWFAPWLEVEGYASYDYLYFPRLNGHCPKRIRGHADTATLGIQCAVLPTWQIAAELGTSATNCHHFFFDHGAIQVRHTLWDEFLCDPLTLVAGAALIIPTTTSLRDFARPYLAPIQLDLSLAAGREWGCQDWWRYRLFAALTCSIGSRGAPQLRGLLSFMLRPTPCHGIGLEIEGRDGLGSKRLDCEERFKGYGPVAVRAVDAGVRYRLQTLFCGYLEVWYHYRLAARNYPANAQSVGLYALMPLNF